MMDSRMAGIILGAIRYQIPVLDGRFILTLSLSVLPLT